MAVGIRWVLALAVAAGCGVSSPVSRELGARCDVAGDCDEVCLVPSDDDPGGLCTVACDGDDACPDRARCVDEEGGVCRYACDGDEDCAFLGEGWRCRERDGLGGEEVTVCRG
jgi:hypothetical protein